MQFIRIMTAAALLVFGASAAAQLSPEDFTARFVENLREGSPDVGVEVVEPLKVVVTKADGTDHTAFLDNAYDLYLQDDSAMQEIMDGYAAALMESVTRDSSVLLASNIVPVVKDSAWLAEIAQVTAEQGQESAPRLFTRPLAEGLTIVFAEDTPSNIRYVGKEDIEEAGVEIESIIEMSVGNLLQRLPDIEKHGGTGLYMITADGNYEASLLLVDNIWNAENFDVQGEIVVSLPARDTLLISGTDESENLVKMTSLAREIYDESPYRLTTDLYVRRGKSWQLYTE